MSDTEEYGDQLRRLFEQEQHSSSDALVATLSSWCGYVMRVIHRDEKQYTGEMCRILSSSAALWGEAIKVTRVMEGKAAVAGAVPAVAEAEAAEVEGAAEATVESEANVSMGR